MILLLLLFVRFGRAEYEASPVSCLDSGNTTVPSGPKLCSFRDCNCWLCIKQNATDSVQYCIVYTDNSPIWFCPTRPANYLEECNVSDNSLQIFLIVFFSLLCLGCHFIVIGKEVLSWRRPKIHNEI